MPPTIEIDAADLCTWPDFHDTFARRFGFPDFYGRNLDAWIDCMGSLDAPEDGMTSVHVANGEILVLAIRDVDVLVARAREIFDALVDCTAFVNHRKLDVGEPAVLALSFHRRSVDPG